MVGIIKTADARLKRTMQLLVNIDVGDLSRAIAFYVSAFGLSTGRRFGADGVELLGASSPIYLLAKPEGSVASGATEELRHYRRHWTPVHLDFVVPDIDAAVARCLASGAVLERAVSTASWGRLALMADPFGNGYCLVQFLGRGYDEIAQPPQSPPE
jgi:predicted enzyme related to lactoylglutathione lyase